jgi:hypothetical protein
MLKLFFGKDDQFIKNLDIQHINIFDIVQIH